MLVVIVTGAIIFIAYWKIAGQVSNISALVITMIALILSPRFDVIETQSGKTLQMKGFPVKVINAWKAWTKNKS